MSKGKARRIDYYPDEYIAGVGGVLRADEQGVYWMLCSLIMSAGGAIEQNDRRFAALCLVRPADIKKIIETLVVTGKILRQSDGKLCQKRAQSEVEKSLNRIQTASENGSNGGRQKEKSRQNQAKSKAGGSSDEKLTTNHQPPTINHQPLREESKASSLDEAFERFWSVYPRKIGKGGAEKSFVKASERAPVQDIIVGAERYAADREGQDPKYTKHAATWLNQDCWTDEVPSALDTDGPNWRKDPLYAGVE